MVMDLTRRLFIGGAAAASVATAAKPRFTFVHVTDMHIQPEMRATDGCVQCFAAINKVKPDFVVTGGDLIFDALATPRKRALSLFSLYKDTVKRIDAPVHNILGNSAAITRPSTSTATIKG